MENATPSSPAPPYSTGAGGRFSKPHVSRKRLTTPYDRPSLTTTTNQSDDGGGWLSKLVVNPARRLIVSGATRILPSFFSNSESPSAEAYEYDSSGDRDNEDVDGSVNAFGDARHTLEASPLDVPRSFGDAGPSNERDKLKGNSANAIIQQNKSTNDFDQIEHMIKGKQFSRDESCRLMEILKSRLVDDSVAEEEKKATNVISQEQDKVNDLDREIPSIWKQYDVETPMPHLQSNIQDEVAASPIDIAKAYMGSRAPETGLNTYGNISTDRREHEHNNPFTSKPHFLIPSSKSSTCWPGAMVQDQRAYLTPQTQRSRYGLHKFPQTPYSRTKPNLYQLQSDSRSPNISLTTLRQSCTPNFQQAKTSSDVVVDDDYESVGPIRRMRNKFVSKPRSEGPRSFSSAQIASCSNASTSFVPVFQRNPITASTSNFHSADKYEQTSNNYANSAEPSNERAKKILDRLDRHMPIPKEKAAELKLPTEWKRLPTQDKTSITPVLAPVTGSNLQKSGTLSENKSFLKGTDGVNFEDDKKTSNAATKIYTSVNDTGAGPSIGFKNTGVANEVPPPLAAGFTFPPPSVCHNCRFHLMAEASSNESPIITTIPISTPSLTIVHFPSSLKLTSTNYLGWKTQVEATLHGLDLFKYIDGTHPPPPPTIAPTGQSLPHPDFSTWFRQDRLLFGALVGTLSPPIVPLITNASSSLDAWKILSNTYASPSRGHIKQLQHRLKQSTKTPTQTITDYMQSVKTLVDELSLLGKSMDAEDITDIVLNGLDQSSYKPVIAAIHARDNPISFHELHEKLINHELSLAQLPSPPPNIHQPTTAFLTHS
ncbi:hypothetical protein E3N88_35816 [Mikania micrantha]|uniref:Retrotransposon Copia-like N-terminal domain-containing protein n=1 Tax=Mikania micrantha TaxID=192012 RepID=A0A5N6M2X2_9ASTR|nr:hypothetical protein E3N88_35816 [Mikania micrantha]